MHTATERKPSPPALGECAHTMFHDNAVVRWRRAWLCVVALAAVLLGVCRWDASARGSVPTLVPLSSHSLEQLTESSHRTKAPAPITIGKKRLWTAGWNARTFPAGALESSPPPILRWSPGAVHVFAAHWERIQVHAASGGSPGGPCARNVRLIPARDYGLMSFARDVGTLLIEDMAAGVATRMWPDKLNPSPRPFCKPARDDDDASVGCFWKQPIANCTVEASVWLRGLDTDSFIGNVAPSYWATMVASKYVWWEDAEGNEVEAPPVFDYGVWGPLAGLPFLRGRGQGPPEWSVFSMVRSMLFETLWTAAEGVQQSVREMEGAFAIAQPMLVLQIRRTDKITDNGVVNFRARFPSGYVPLSEYGKMARLVEDSLDVTFQSVLLLSDDLDCWTRRDEWLAEFRNASIAALYNPYWLRYRTLFESPEWKKMGHTMLRFDVEPTMYSFHRELVADMTLAVRHGRYLVGCGSSGVSQFVAQGLGHRFMVESSWLSYFEEDHFAAGL